MQIGLWVSNTWEKFAPDATGHVIWHMRSGCKSIINGILWEMSEVITHNLRMDRCRTFKLCAGVDHVTRHVQTLTKVKRSRSQGHVMCQQQECYN